MPLRSRKMNPVPGGAQGYLPAGARTGGAVPRTVPARHEGSSWRAEARDLGKRAHDLLDTGRHADAVDLYTRAIELDPHDARYFGDRAYAFCALRKYEQAVADCKMAIRLRPYLSRHRIQLGRALFGLGHYQEAIKSFEWVLRRDPTSEEAEKEVHAARVHLLLSMGFDIDEADRALQTNGGDVERAVDALRRPPRVGPKMDPANPRGWRSLRVRGITTEVTRDTLWRHFSAYGLLEAVQVRHERNRALVTFRKPEAATAAMNSMQGKVFCGQRMELRFADTPSAPIQPKTVDADLGGGGCEQASGDACAGAVGGGLASSTARAQTVRPEFRAEQNECPSWRQLGWCRYRLNCHQKHLLWHQGIDRKPAPDDERP